MISARSRTTRTLYLIVGVISLSGLVACAADWAVDTYKNWHRIQLSHCETAVVRSFAQNEFRPGDPVASLTDRHEPNGSIRHGAYATYFYDSPDGEVWVIARDGQLVGAYLCGYQIRGFTFFETRSVADMHESSRQREQVLTERFALLTVAGFAAASHPPPQ